MSNKNLNILITGSSGLIGTTLSQSLTNSGHTIYNMERPACSNAHFSWLPENDIINFDESIAIDVIINLSGSNISDGRWTSSKKKIIYNSRVKSTKLLTQKIAELKHPPKVFISASAIGFYGETGDFTVSEQSDPGKDFLAHVALKWESATQLCKDAGIRTVNLRTGIVLSEKGGALNKMLFPFKLGLGGVIGNGKQYMSWISIKDVTSIIEFIIDNDSIDGPVNMVSPAPVTNYEFTKTLGKVLSRPTIFPMPAYVAKLIFGEMADALLLTGIRVKPDKLLSAGYTFIDNDLYPALKSVLNKK